MQPVSVRGIVRFGRMSAKGFCPFGAGELQKAPLRVREAWLPYERLAPPLLNRCGTKLALSGYPPSQGAKGSRGLGRSGPPSSANLIGDQLVCLGAARGRARYCPLLAYERQRVLSFRSRRAPKGASEGKGGLAAL